MMVVGKGINFCISSEESLEADNECLIYRPLSAMMVLRLINDQLLMK